MSPRPSARRTAVDRWIASLSPLFAVINTNANSLGLGVPQLTVGPAFMKGELESMDRIRRGAVWFIDRKNTGFHVDIMTAGIRVEAWCGTDRKASVWIAGKATPRTLTRDLDLVFAAAGLNTCAESEKLTDELFNVRTSESTNRDRS